MGSPSVIKDSILGEFSRKRTYCYPQSVEGDTQDISPVAVTICGVVDMFYTPP